MQGRTGHLGYILAADRKVNLNALADLLAGLLRQSQKHVRDALLNLLVRDLHDPGLCVLQPAAHDLQRAAG
ncbi:Uncharacterised protein [Mycobacterium tuberculosis]|nr:Uncharacterised protein [Mycobacterium tuberculosis]